MTRLDVKPWSEEAEALDGAEASEVEAPSREAAARPHSDAESIVTADAVQRWRSRAAAMGPEWAFVPIGLALLWGLWTAVAPPVGRPGAARLHGAGLLLLIFASGGALWIGLDARRRALRGIERFVSGDHASAGESLPPDLRALADAVTRRLASSEQELRRLQEREQRLSLERRVADLQRRQIDSIIQSIVDPVFVTDEFDRLVLANPAAESLLGFSHENDLRRPIDELLPDETMARLVRQCREAGSASARRNVEHTIGERVYAITLSNVESGDEGARWSSRGRGVVAVLRDVTKDREVARAKSEFVANVAHELRTPLSSIKAYVEMLVDGEAADEKTRRDYYEIIQTSSDRLGRLIDNMLNISRIESGTVRVNKEPVSLAVVVKEVLDVARPQADAKSIQLADELMPVFHQVLADRDMLYQAVLNLVSNALKYTPQGGAVTVKMAVHEEQRTVTTSVTDTGVGIPEADLPRMFEKFFRVQANSKMAKGTGLGLNLVKHIVETVHGGQVRVTSKEQQGSTFSITLPLHAEGS